jgi:Tol biopolymer transport system component
MGLDGSDVVDLGESSGLDSMGYEALADPGWSPDGSRIAVLAKAGYEWHLYVMGAYGSDLRRLDAIPWEVDEVNPSWAWSPDGSTIALQHATLVEPSEESCPHKDRGRTDPCFDATWITLIDVEDGEQRELDSTRAPGHGDGSIWGSWSWSPDGQSIVLQRESHPHPEMVDVASDTSTELPWESDSAPSWQRVAAD